MLDSSNLSARTSKHQAGSYLAELWPRTLHLRDETRKFWSPPDVNSSFLFFLTGHKDDKHIKRIIENNFNQQLIMKLDVDSIYMWSVSQLRDVRFWSDWCSTVLLLFLHGLYCDTALATPFTSQILRRRRRREEGSMRRLKQQLISVPAGKRFLRFPFEI